ncbi:MAG: hypothetical protein WBM07_14985 [Chitinivibrionales bacterium]
MGKIHYLAAMMTVLAASALFCFGEDTATTFLKLKPSGFASMELGEIVKGGVNSKTGEPMDNTWMKNLIAGLSVDAILSERNSLAIGMEMQMYNDFPITSALLSYPEFRYLYFYPYLNRAEYTHVFGDVKTPYLSLSAGYFPFKYNSDVKNLGEYLFRTGTYPQYILDEFDFPLARLLGVHASITPHIPFNDLKIDVIAYSNLQWYAVGDWNLAIIASDKVADFIDVGLGMTFNSILSADSTVTTPHNPATLYHVTYNAATGTSDSSFYTFRGSKLMAKAAVDLKKFISSDFFGKEDLRLYGEAAILGLTDYPRNFNGGVSYDSILERIPLMAGFNVPTFKLLDVLSAEVEYFKCPFPNDVGALTNYGLPIPGPVNATGTTNYWANREYWNDRWKWSVHASKKIATNYTIMVQVASDHLRPLAVNDQNVDFEEIFHNTNQWYYMLKFTAGF